MTDLDTLQRIAEITGCGNITSCVPSGLGTKDSWAWQVQNKADFEHVVEMLRPWLSERRLARLDEVEAALTWRDHWWRAGDASSQRSAA